VWRLPAQIGPPREEINEACLAPDINRCGSFLLHSRTSRYFPISLRKGFSMIRYYGSGALTGVPFSLIQITAFSAVRLLNGCGESEIHYTNDFFPRHHTSNLTSEYYIGHRTSQMVII
jgi:hypothetical protein